MENSEDLFSNDLQNKIKDDSHKIESELCITEYSQNYSHDPLIQSTQNRMDKEHLKLALNRFDAVAEKTFVALNNIRENGFTAGNLICFVLNTFPLHEVWLNRAKTWITRAVVLLGDYTQENTEVKMCLWKDNCKLALTLKMGDVLCLGNFKVTTFESANMILLNHSSYLINFGSSKFIQSVLPEINAVKDCAQWYMKHYALQHKVSNLLSNIDNGSNVILQDFALLNPGNVVHIRAKIMSIKSYLKINEPLVMCVADKYGNFCSLYLHGSATGWFKRINKFSKHKWEFYNVACCTSSVCDEYELHTSVFSSAQCLVEEELEENTLEIKSISSFQNLQDLLHTEEYLHLQNVRIHRCTFFTSKCICVLNKQKNSISQTILSLISAYKENFPDELISALFDCTFELDQTVFELRIKQKPLFHFLGLHNKRDLSFTKTTVKMAAKQLNALISEPQSLQVEVKLQHDQNEIIKSLNVFIYKIKN